LFDDDLTGSSSYFDVPKMLIVPLTKVRFNETQKFILTHLTGRKTISTYASR
jgi:hypothetical protein